MIMSAALAVLMIVVVVVVGDGATIPSALAASSSATATDGKGTVIGDKGVTKSAEMTIAGYSESEP